MMAFIPTGEGNILKYLLTKSLESYPFSSRKIDRSYKNTRLVQICLGVALLSPSTDAQFSFSSVYCSQKRHDIIFMDQGPDYLGSPMYHRQIRNTTGIAM